MAATTQPTVDPVIFMSPDNFAAMLYLTQMMLVQGALQSLANLNHPQDH